eukprot:8307772-Karenia_brevis.AAC.1
MVGSGGRKRYERKQSSCAPSLGKPSSSPHIMQFKLVFDPPATAAMNTHGPKRHPDLEKQLPLPESYWPLLSRKRFVGTAAGPKAKGLLVLSGRR